jgi:hypothetical protein
VTNNRPHVQPSGRNNKQTMSASNDHDVSMEDDVCNLNLPPLEDMTDAYEMIEKWLEESTEEKASDLRAFKHGELGFDAFFAKYLEQGWLLERTGE